CHWRLEQRPLLIAEHDGSRLRLYLDGGRLQHAARTRADRQERTVSAPPLLPERGQHHRHDLVIALQHAEERWVEAPREIPVGRALKVVVEAEFVEKLAELGVVVMSETFVTAEWIGNAGQRQSAMLDAIGVYRAQIVPQHLLVRDIVR